MFGLSADDWCDLVLSVNVHRKNRRLSPVDVARLIKKANVKSDESTVAEALGFQDLTTFRRIKRLNLVPEDLAELVVWGRGEERGSLSMSAASELLRLPQDQYKPAFKAAVEYRLSKEEARQVIQIGKRTGKPINECVEQALSTRVRIERSELIIGSLLTESARSVLEQLGPKVLARKVKRKLAAKFPTVICQSLRFKGCKMSILFKEEDAVEFRKYLERKSVEQCITEIVETIGSD